MPLISYFYFTDSSNLKDFEVLFISRTILDFYAWLVYLVMRKQSEKNEHMQALCVEPVNRYLYSKAHVLNSKHESLGQAIFSILHTSNQSKIKIWTHQSRSWRFGVVIKTLCGETIAYIHNIYIEREREICPLLWKIQWCLLTRLFQGQWRNLSMSETIWNVEQINSSPSHGTSHWKISWGLEAVRFYMLSWLRLWDLTSTAAKTPVKHRNDRTATSGGRLNLKDGLTRYGDSHVKDKTS